MYIFNFMTGEGKIYNYHPWVSECRQLRYFITKSKNYLGKFPVMNNGSVCVIYYRRMVHVTQTGHMNNVFVLM